MAEPTISTSDLSALAGQTFTDEKGNKYKIIKASTNALANGDIVVYTGADGFTVDTTTSASSKVAAGIIMDTIAASGYGRCMVYGVHTAAKVDGGTTDVDTAGLVGTSGVAGYAYTVSAVGTVVGKTPSQVTTKTTGVVYVNVM